MVKGKIIYDDVIRIREDWENELGLFRESSRTKILDNDLVDNQYFDALQSHYFAILHDNPQEIRSKIMCQVKHKLGIQPIAEHAILDSGKNCEIYRISVPREITIYRKEIYDVQSRWIKDKTLHSKGPQAIRNLIEKMESGEF